MGHLANNNDSLGSNNQFTLIDSYQHDHFSDDDFFQQDQNYVEYDDNSHLCRDNFNSGSISQQDQNDMNQSKNPNNLMESSLIGTNNFSSFENNDFMDDEKDKNITYADDLEFFDFRSHFHDEFFKNTSNLLKNHINNNQKKVNLRRLSSKKKVELSIDECDFKYNFYQIFTSRKRFAKTIVRDIHNYMSENYFKFNKMTRDQFRNIDLYFHEYSKYKEQILIYLKNHKTLILESVQGLSQF